MHSKVQYDPTTDKYIVSLVDGKYRTKGPLNVGFQITRDCNRNCAFCSENAVYDPTSNGSDGMTLDAIKTVLDNLKEAGVSRVNLTGGEPLLRPDIIEIIDAARSKELSVAISSNATLLTNNLADQLRGKLVYFEIGLNGLKELEGDQSEVTAITMLTKRDISVYLTYVLVGTELRKLFKEAEQIIIQAEELGVSSIKFRSPRRKGRGATMPEDCFSPKIMPALFEHIAEFKLKKGLNIRIVFNDWTTPHNGKFILIHPDGTMVGTPNSEDASDNLVIGNVFDESVEKMWAKYPYIDNHVMRYINKSRIII